MWEIIGGKLLERGEGIKFWVDQNALPMLGNQYRSDSIMAIIFDLPRGRGDYIMGKDATRQEEIKYFISPTPWKF